MKQKQLYSSPETEVMELKPEGIICLSGLAAPAFEDGGDLDSYFS